MWILSFNKILGDFFFYKKCSRRGVYWQANNIRIAVAVMFPGDLLQQPTTPVQNAENIARKPTMNRAITDLPISVTYENEENTIALLAHILTSTVNFAMLTSLSLLRYQSSAIDSYHTYY